MEAEPLIEPVDFASDEPTFWARFWRRPSRAGWAWSTEDWLLTGAGDVAEALDWARARSRDGDRFEMHVVTANGDHVRVFGSPPEETFTTVEVVLTEG
ncbi:hypothetical protein NQ156_01590 [Microbacterium sp. zg.Y625]|uniref:hypothetical protein n=1 Tax=Microbacterium jiangjiandongii TaxID=3049071 RepID=UPI00214C9973|nr:MULTISPECIES: hypothetical protein [unclassified Microbacterium]MCR2791753.1 hypothetical protein [Microbacterium sp. zg.Y625]MCR2816534.1 hypothetical protein [Microbacterium sp. zg.Y843]WIM24570.1 hypothetical protein QNO14_10500 [Microbacterium sp. zg-Y625]